MEVTVKLYTLLKKYGEGKIGNDGLLSLPEDEGRRPKKQPLGTGVDSTTL